MAYSVIYEGPNVNKLLFKLVVLAFVVLSFMKYRLGGIPLSDLALLVVSSLAFIKTGACRLSPYPMLLAMFILICITLAIVAGNGDSLMSSAKLLVPLFAICVFYRTMSRMPLTQLFDMVGKVLFFGVYSQLFLVVLFYSGLFPSLFNVIESGHAGREFNTLQVNVFLMPLLNVHRFGGFFIEPSWFAMFFGFFLLVYFYLERKSGAIKISRIQHTFIIGAFLLTLSLTSLCYLIFAYSYRFFDMKKPLRLLVLLPCVTVLIVWFVFNNEYLSQRIYLILSGNDGSFNARVFASLYKAVYVLEQSQYLGVAPGQPLSVIELHFDNKMSIQNAYLEVLAATGFLGFVVFFLAMHLSGFLYRNAALHIPLMLGMFVSSVVFTPIFWMQALVVLVISRKLYSLKYQLSYPESRFAAS